jgi:hypothetical protein
MTTLYRSLSYKDLCSQSLFTALLGNVFQNWKIHCFLANISQVDGHLIPASLCICCLKTQNRSYFTTDSQSVSMSWYRAPLWDLQPDIISWQNVAVWNLRSCIYGAPSLTRGQVCNLRCNRSMVQVAQNLKPYFTVSSETPPIWRARFLYLYPPGTRWPSYTPGHWVLFTSSFTTRLLRLTELRWRYSNPPPTWRDRSVYI